jgi:hypothetical protein
MIVDEASPLTFNKAKYAVSAAELAQASTRDAALNKIQGYLDELRAAKKRGDRSSLLCRKQSIR